MAVAAINIPKGSQISPATERVYHQTNLIGDWKGTWKDSGRQLEFKVVNIRGSQATIEYTHDGRTERGVASVDGATITYGDITIGTKNGSVAVLEFSSGVAKKTAVLAKVPADPADQNKLVGSWSGFSKTNGQSAFFQVVSVNGTDAQVRFTANGGTIQSGDGIVSQNTVMFNGAKAQFSSKDGQTGTITFKSGLKTYAVPVTKSKTPAASTPTSTNAVNKLA
jgi:hypothetical protein